MRWLSSTVAISTVVLGACGSEPTAAPAPQVANSPPAAMSAKAPAPTSPTSPTIAIDDVVSRVLVALDQATQTSLTGPLKAVQSALKLGDANSIAGAIAIARNALAAPMAANDDRAPELASIALALDAVDTTK